MSESIEQGVAEMDMGASMSFGDMLRQRSQRRRMDAIAEAEAMPEMEATEKQKFVDGLEGLVKGKLLRSNDEISKFEMLIYPIKVNNQLQITVDNAHEWGECFHNLANRLGLRAFLGVRGISFYWS